MRLEALTWAYVVGDILHVKWREEKKLDFFFLVICRPTMAYVMFLMTYVMLK